MSEPLTLTVRAPAKLNLVLAVGDRRDDGYHELVSVLHAIDLCDELTVTIEPAVVGVPTSSHESSRIHVVAPTLPGGDTLVTRALQALCAELELHLHVEVTLDKAIPAGAGLGGGSSDAAAALRALNRLLGEPLAHGDLVRIAAGIGSDVPFFLYPSGSAVVTGRGELVEQVDPIPSREWLVAWPGVEQSTARVYEKFRTRREALPTRDQVIARAHAGDYENDLAHIACTICREINRLDSLLRWAGARPVVAGSGSAMFAPVDSSINVARLLDAARGLPGAHVWLASSYSEQTPGA